MFLAFLVLVLVFLGRISEKMPVVTRSRARGERVRTAPTRTSARIRNRNNNRGRGRGRGGGRGRARVPRPGANRFRFQSPPRLVSRRRPRRGEDIDDVDTEEFSDYTTEEYPSSRSCETITVVTPLRMKVACRRSRMESVAS